LKFAHHYSGPPAAVAKPAASCMTSIL